MRPTFLSPFASDHEWSPHLWTGLLALALLATACDTGNSGFRTPTVADLTASRTELTVLAGGLQQADLADELSDRDTTFTVFAPVNSAFESIDSQELGTDADLLKEVLSYHIVPGKKIMAADVEDGQWFTTADGDSLALNVTGSTLQVNDDTVSSADLEGANGVVHLVDGVLLEGVDATTRTALSPRFALFAGLVAESDLGNTLAGVGPDGEDGLTVFAPTNQALLDAYDDNGNDQLDEEEIPSNPATLVKYHVVDDVYYVQDVPSSPTELPTLEGSTVTVEGHEGNATVNSSTVTTPDELVENGVIHGIDTVLSPPGN